MSFCFSASPLRAQVFLLRSAHACRGNAGTDEEGTTEPIEGGDDTRAGNEPARPRRDEAVGCGIGECESDEGGLEDEHLGPKILLRSMNCRRNATKNVRLLGLSAVPSQAWPSMRGAGACARMGTASRAPPARQSWMPSQTRYRAPAHLRAVNRSDEVASNAPSPSMDSVMAVKSPSATPTATGSAVRMPWPRAQDTTSKMVGPGMTSSTAVAAVNASQVSMLIACSVSRPFFAVSWRGARVERLPPLSTLPWPPFPPPGRRGIASHRPQTPSTALAKILRWISLEPP